MFGLDSSPEEAGVELSRMVTLLINSSTSAVSDLLLGFADRDSTMGLRDEPPCTSMVRAFDFDGFEALDLLAAGLSAAPPSDGETGLGGSGLGGSGLKPDSSASSLRAGSCSAGLTSSSLLRSSCLLHFFGVKTNRFARFSSLPHISVHLEFSEVPPTKGSSYTTSTCTSFPWLKIPTTVPRAPKGTDVSEDRFTTRSPINTKAGAFSLVNCLPFSRFFNFTTAVSLASAAE
mmetsp:Transcript_2364/g.9948  ORF Transcript_2364/g.9948 Transcript_2364/m.9948 type:complete len:232 (-) Transcript_2364:4100-4795(-)